MEQQPLLSPALNDHSLNNPTPALPRTYPKTESYEKISHEAFGTIRMPRTPCKRACPHCGQYVLTYVRASWADTSCQFIVMVIKLILAFIYVTIMVSTCCILCWASEGTSCAKYCDFFCVGEFVNPPAKPNE